eukprot:TRINITY_DN2326_c0_g1_i10.p2 TRINITY_DN2326_c0_g1~~TRINITY_DN2326_c0_g1_i10.p2  ORF type:complete len:144 (-),score=24.83 TRINITY_DN2326_c0_g1_i10:63-494(-)
MELDMKHEEKQKEEKNYAQKYLQKVAEYRQKFEDVWKKVHLMEGKLKGIQKASRVVKSLKSDGRIEELMQELDVTVEQAMEIFNMKFSDLLPTNKEMLQQEIIVLQGKVKQYEQRALDYEACLRVMKYEQSTITGCTEEKSER